MCMRPVGSKDYAVQCENCENWIHCECAEISITLYKCLMTTKSKAIHVDCLRCRPNICPPTTTECVDMQGEEAEIETSVDLDQTIVHTTPVSESTPGTSESSDYEDRKQMKSYAAAVAGASGQPAVSSPMKVSGVQEDRKKPRPRVKDLLVRLQNVENALSKSPSPKTVGTTPLATTNRHDRNQAFILFNAAESDDVDLKTRIDHDRCLLENMVSKLFDVGESGISVISAFRLGKRSNDPVTYPRPLKVVVSSEKECLRVFARTYRLKSEKYQVARDLSPEDRTRMKEAVQELKRRRAEGETNLMIQDFRVIRRPPRVAWKPITILPQVPCKE